ncbi:hypothetical protein ACIBCT_12820 [Streptosporangium sp. NPDC050855]|uniref:hypothetical protein n=1 Tax=Streptosporangium sp. NPDC050855 TaxID=3366194 RepID=UPI0037AF50BA
MSISPEDAARTLADVRTTQARALRAEPWFPAWYPVGVALFATGVTFVSEPGTDPAVTAGGIVVLTIALVGLVLRLTLTARMRAHRSLLEPAALTGFVVWVLASVGVAFAVAFPLDAAGVAYSGTYGCLVMTAFMAATGPLVGRWISSRLAAGVEQAKETR